MSSMKVKVLLLLMVIIVGSGCVRQRITLSPGDYADSITVDGLDRTYLIHVPPTYNGSPQPLVIVLHGGGDSAQRMVALTGFNTISDREGFIVVYPEGVENYWNDGKANRKNIDDVKFISTLIDHVRQELNIDETRIYATGISNGAMMSCRLACELSHRIAAVAMVAGAMPEDLHPHCSPSSPVSVVVMDGTEDPSIVWERGQIRAEGKTLSVYDTVLFWVHHNDCSESPQVTMLEDTDPDDGTTVQMEVYSQGEKETEVILYTIEGGGHTWPGSPRSSFDVGGTSYDITASEVIWQFFRAHPKVR